MSVGVTTDQKQANNNSNLWENYQTAGGISLQNLLTSYIKLWLAREYVERGSKIFREKRVSLPEL